MAMVAASMLYPAIPSSNGSIIRLTLCSSNHFSVNVKDFVSIKCRSFPSQLTRGSSLKGNTRQADEEAEEPGLEFMGSIEDNQNEMRNLSRSETDSLHVSGQNDSNFIDASNVDNMGDKQSEDNESDDELISGETAMKGSIIAGLLLVGVVGGFGAASYIYKDQINDFLLKFSDFIEGFQPYH
ncbi:hypothetical protein KP509_17G048300 [Ceratopteris richardii]|uniref:Uncharacterized protein n=1 Tax=Ceratopteris richardii TaxID=49495 RepID=A0A8T2SY15_CERRI|nr:hypothetical protein KP509_17G048300 [Ceratopteris richardii]